MDAQAAANNERRIKILEAQVAVLFAFLANVVSEEDLGVMHVRFDRAVENGGQ